MSTLKAVLHPKYDKNGNKNYRLTLRLTVNRKRSYYQLANNIDPELWDANAEKIKTKHPKHKQLNRLIRKKYDEIEDYILELESTKKNFTAKQVMETIKKNKKKITFFELAQDHVEDLIKEKKHNRAISDQSMVNRIKGFVKNKNLSFEEIDESLLKKMKIDFANKKNLSETYIMNILVLVRLIFNRAIEKNIVDQKFYPFGRGKIKIKYPESIKIGLDETEIRKIQNLDLTNRPEIAEARDVFLFSFYLAGIRISDVLKMKWKDILDGRIYYKMGKNGKTVTLKIPQQINRILSNYTEDKKSESDYIFPYMKGISKNKSKEIYNKIKATTKSLNKNLKTLAEIAGIDKKITNHIARHSFGNIAGDKATPQMLQKLYRHSHISTTMNYQSNFIHKSADEALDSIISF